MKDSYEELAILGGTPAFAEPVHVGRPNVGDRRALHRRLDEILDSRWLTNHGPMLHAFERRIADFVRVKHCVAMCNATLALEIAIRALGLADEVIVPAFTFVATAHALQWQQIRPVFCDIDPVTHNIDPACVEKAITPRTTGIIGVHLWGRPCNIDALTDIAQRRGLKLLFDAAQAFGSSYKGKPIGGFGQAEVFSFHATKFVNSFEGGVVVANDDRLAAKMRLMRNFGFVEYDEVTSIGTNAKMPEASAAMGLTSLEAIEEAVAANRRNYELYRKLLEPVRGLSMIQYDPQQTLGFQYVVVEVDEDSAGVSRDRLVEILFAENVLARRYFFPGCHRMEPYRTLYPNAGTSLRATEAVASRVLLLPTSTSVNAEQIALICDVIRLAVSHSSKIASRLAERGPQRMPLKPGHTN